MTQMLTSIRLVLRDHSDVAALPHVVEAITAYLDNFSTKWTVAAAAERGFVHLLTYLAERQAAQEPDFPELLFNMDDPLIRAARHGHLDALRWLLEYRPDDLIPVAAMDVAAEGGHLEIVRWLHDHDRDEGCTKQAMDNAAGNGHLEVVQWLHENRTEGCTDMALNRAAAGGHLEVVQFLVQRQEGNVTEAMVHAVQCGRLEVLRWLGETPAKKWMLEPDESLTVIQWLGRHEARVSSWRSTFNAAAAGGHLNVIVWLMENGITYCTADAMTEAARNGHLETVRWLHENRTEGCTTSAMDDAASRGHVDVVRFLHVNRKEGCTRNAMLWAAEFGHLEVLRFLHDHRSEGITSEMMERAASNGHQHVLKWLHDNSPRVLRPYGAMQGAACGGYLDIVQWLDENYPSQYAGHVLETVAQRGDVPVMMYLLTNIERLFDQFVPPPIRAVIENGHLEIVKMIHAMFPLHPVHPAEVEWAAPGGHLELVKWLYEHRCPSAACSPRTMKAVAGNGHLATLRWLIECKGHKCTTGAIDRAAHGGHLEIIRYLFRKRHTCCTIRTMENAVAANHARVVKWLIANCPEQFYTERALKTAIKTAQRCQRGLLEAWLTSSLDRLRGKAIEADTSQRSVRYQKEIISSS